jgi:hypothetical protein
MVAAASANAALARRLVAEPFVTNAGTRTRRLTSVDVVATVAPTNGLEETRAIAARGSGNTPTRIGAGHTLVTDEAVGRGLAVHRFVAPSPVPHLGLAAIGGFEGIRLAIGAAHVALVGTHRTRAGLTASSKRKTEAANGHTSYPESTHHFSSDTASASR